MLQLFWYSFFIGLFLAIPLGPIAFLCIYRSLHRGIKLGLITGAGAAIADGFFGALAGIGLIFIARFLLCNFVTFICGDRLTNKTMRIINKSSGYIFIEFNAVLFA